MANYKLHSTLSREELEDRFNKLFNQRGYANLEMQKNLGILYLSKKPYIDPITKGKYPDALNPLQIEIELKSTKDGTLILVNTQTTLWATFIGISVGGLIWFTLLAFWIAGQIESLYPFVLAAIVSAILVFLVKKSILTEKNVLMQIENEIRIT